MPLSDFHSVHFITGCLRMGCVQAWVDNDKHTCPYCRTDMGKEVKMVEFV